MIYIYIWVSQSSLYLSWSLPSGNQIRRVTGRHPLPLVFKWKKTSTENCPANQIWVPSGLNSTHAYELFIWKFNSYKFYWFPQFPHEISRFNQHSMVTRWLKSKPLMLILGMVGPETPGFDTELLGDVDRRLGGAPVRIHSWKIGKTDTLSGYWTDY